MPVERKWRTEAWRLNHPLSWQERLHDGFHAVTMPMRRFLGRVMIAPQQSYLEIAARFKTWQHIDGDYCEFGVYTGASFVQMFHLLSKLESERGYHEFPTRFFAFDSFEGLPQIGGEDRRFAQLRFRAGEFDAPRTEFESNLQRSGVDLARVTVVPGWYSEVLTPELPARIGLKQVSIAYVDCDLYESAVPVLNFLTDLLVDGAVLIFDDWNVNRAHPQLGVQGAFHEWSARNPHLRFSEISGLMAQRAFIVHRPLE
ncbi:MAG: class I SAM-dependent methyltransferase [Burkholderiales bacterium]|nr:class I SAM-dependent methyltransferase [Anaerolineae bacterium]